MVISTHSLTLSLLSFHEIYNPSSSTSNAKRKCSLTEKTLATTIQRCDTFEVHCHILLGVVHVTETWLQPAWRFAKFRPIGRPLMATRCRGIAMIPAGIRPSEKRSTTPRSIRDSHATGSIGWQKYLGSAGLLAMVAVRTYRAYICVHCIRFKVERTPRKSKGDI